MKYVAYYRVSTQRQGMDGYGMAAQQEAVARFLKSGEADLIGQYQEVESGTCTKRPQLALALALAKLEKATILIAKLDRLSRNHFFLLQLQQAGVSFVCCDAPHLDSFTINIISLVAERERDLISQRTKAGLAVAKSRGKVLGNPNAAQAWTKALASIQERKNEFRRKTIVSIEEIRSTGIKSLNRLADCLNKRGEQTSRGKRFTATAVRRILEG